jgi:hypothetical protein
MGGRVVATSRPTVAVHNRTADTLADSPELDAIVIDERLGYAGDITDPSAAVPCVQAR